VGEELSYGEPHAFWWGGPHADLGHMLIQHVIISNLTDLNHRLILQHKVGECAGPYESGKGTILTNPGWDGSLDPCGSVDREYVVP
jgi:hypothetical protein